MNKSLFVLPLAVISILATAAYADSAEKKDDTTVEHSTSLMGTKKTTVKSKHKSKAADGSDVEHTFKQETKVHKNGKIEQEAKENVEVTPPDKK